MRREFDVRPQSGMIGFAPHLRQRGVPIIRAGTVEVPEFLVAEPAPSAPPPLPLTLPETSVQLKLLRAYLPC